ncbi:MAG: aminotransferase class I/II-fold pyridoxal phosphate-dependent enzyme, partial [Aliifodinibius sp.]|nr:aminotransferase class I/II-fold pyridoxal phosphate-dependent enzyme [candidate division Zixibacteria bacterium]NIT59798.1 aminotransferase class I/II-fold pyridoxal phosphate-dependent enzyme [Fodinibius sp.]NIW47273.1 aminotransferase class I/II-fold pyridoxal phosphate-dependent enzyme [Gammaproteobacteria bacterium]NIR66123.1 aminotransferase class I/II-fold pyridoxal phosphate-dependent enzyme [candidate division Zixibacteria bacterium]NIS47744.1 aminotransferase class I/II-fold pyrido
LEAEGAYQVLAKAQDLEANGREIIHLEIGEPDFPTPQNIKNAGSLAIEQGKTRYNPPVGIKELREILAADASQRKGVEIKPEEVVIGPGAKPFLFFPTLALVEPGDEVIYPNPGFPTYEAMIQVAGGIPVPIPLLEERQFAFDLDVLKEKTNKNTKLI